MICADFKPGDTYPNPMEWYYVKDNQRQGPLAQADFDGLIASQTITADTLVWRQGMAQWQPYSAVRVSAAAVLGGDPAAPADDTEVCVVSGKRYPKREMIQYEGQWISAEHRDAFFQQLREGVAPTGIGAVPGPYGYGGFWRRFLARLVDGIILWVVNTVVAVAGAGIFGATGGLNRRSVSSVLLLQGSLMAVNFAVNVGYEVFFVRKFDATPGKMALGLKILRPNGEKLSALRIVGRQFGQIVSALILCIGYIMAGVDEEKRALHDRICDTRVIRTRR